LSLIADLLSKVKHKERQGVIPPNLAQVVERASGKQKMETRMKIIFLVILLFIACGFGTIYVVSNYLKPVLPVPVTQRVQKPESSRADQAPATEKSAPSRKTEQAVQPPTIVSVPATKKEIIINPPPVSQETLKQADKSLSLSTNIVKNHQHKDIAARTDVAVVRKTPQSEKSGKISELDDISKNERDVALYTARTYEQNKNYGQAIAYYKKVLEKDPRNYMVLNNLASALIKTGSFKESIQYSMDSLTIQKDYVPSLVNLGVANIQLGNIAEGEMYLLKAKSIEQSNKAVLFNLGLLYEKTSNYRESLTAFQRLAAMKDAEGYLGMARVLEKQGNRAEAEKTYREILSTESLGPAARQLASERLQVIGNR
jgi:predicted Zn-dependent protease